jgi:hypothetical protein
VKKTITIGKMGARQAKAKLGEIMSTINRADYVITSQINVGPFLDEYATKHVGRLAASTRAKFTNHIKNRIRPAFEKMMLCDIQPLIVQEWVNAKPFSWATRTDIRNTDEQTRRRLGALLYEVRVAACVCLFCTLRVSEVFGLQEDHLDFDSARF